MLKLARLLSFIAAFAILAVGSYGSTRQTGGSYTLSINGGTAFPISSIDFGSTSVVNTGGGSSAGKTQLSPVTITASTGTTQLYSLFSSCLTGQHLAKVSAVFANAQGQTQFTVAFQPVIVTRYTFPTVDTTSAALGDITIVLTVGADS